MMYTTSHKKPQTMSTFRENSAAVLWSCFISRHNMLDRSVLGAWLRERKRHLWHIWRKQAASYFRTPATESWEEEKNWNKKTTSDQSHVAQNENKRPFSFCLTIRWIVVCHFSEGTERTKRPITNCFHVASTVWGILLQKAKQNGRRHEWDVSSRRRGAGVKENNRWQS